MRNKDSMICAVLLILTSTLSVTAQRAAFLKDIHAMNKKLVGLNYYMKIKYSVHGYTKEEGDYSLVDYYKWGTMTYAHSKEVDNYENDKYKLVVYHQDQRAILNGPNQLKAPSVGEQLDMWRFMSDTFVSMYKDVKLIKIVGVKKYYRVYYPDNIKEYSHSDIVIDTVIHLPVLLKLYYKQSVGEIFGGYLFDDKSKNQKPVLNIEYFDFRELTEADKPYFYCNNIEFNNRKVSLKGPLKYYKLDNFYLK